MTQGGTNIQVLLDDGNGINHPTWLHSDKTGEHLTVINEGGQEIRSYSIYKVTRFFLGLLGKFSSKLIFN